MQFAVTSIRATTKAEKKKNDKSGGATESTRGDISNPIEWPKLWVVGGSRQNVKRHSNASF